MITPSVIGIDVNIFLLPFVGLAVGIIGGFIGVGGGYMVTPSLVVLGFLGYAAVGVNITRITGKSVVAATTHLHQEKPRAYGWVLVSLFVALMVLFSALGIYHA